jgi:hypothetical protein
MSSMGRVGRGVVVGTALVAMTSTLALAAPTGDEPPADARGRYSNFHVLEKGYYYGEQNLGFVRDANDVTHAMQQRGDTDPQDSVNDAGLVYASRSSGGTHWRRTYVPDSSKARSGVLATSPRGGQVYLAAAVTCGVHVVAAPASSNSLPSLTKYPKVVRDCASYSSSAWQARAIVGLPHGRVAVLVNRSASEQAGDDADDDGTYVFIGRPGGHWKQTRVTDEGAESREPLFLARDANTDMLFVAGGGPRVYTKVPGGKWSEPYVVPTPVDPISGGESWVTGLAAMHGQAWLSYQLSNYTSPPAADGVYLSHRDRGGVWSEPVRFRSSDENSISLRLVADANHRVLYAVYGERNYSDETGHAGLYALGRKLHQGWSDPEHLTHWYNDEPLHLTVTTKGQLRFEFVRH